MFDTLFCPPLLPVVTLLTMGGSGWAMLCALRTYDASVLLQWAASLTAVGYMSGSVGAILGRIIGAGFGHETLGSTLGLALGLFFGLTIGVLVARCLFELLMATGGWHFQRAWNITGVVGGLSGGLLVGCIAGWSRRRY